MPEFRGLTWDHPRGRQALEMAAAGATLIEWDVHTLEGFESSPIDELASRYDVIVLDHPHLGDALKTGALRPIDELFDASWLAGLDCVGPSIRSYTLDNHLWALPLDAATQVSARLPGVEMPRTWTDVLEFSRRLPVALSLAGPHAYLSTASLCVALDAAPAVDGTAQHLPAAAIGAIELLAAIAENSVADTANLNPIGTLERMRRDRDISYVPLIYGYVPYAQGPDPVLFGNAPTASAIGSTIGGTGLAISARCTPTPALIEHLRWLLDPVTQSTFIPDNAGQPSLTSAWRDERVNEASNRFYLDSLATIEASWVRPRLAGFTAFQGEASRILREAILGHRSAASAVAETNERFAALGDRP